jgi:hypothetical protein
VGRFVPSACGRGGSFKKSVQVTALSKPYSFSKTYLSRTPSESSIMAVILDERVLPGVYITTASNA